MTTIVPILVLLLLFGVVLAGWAALPVVLILLVMGAGVWIAIRTSRGKTPTPR